MLDSVLQAVATAAAAGAGAQFGGGGAEGPLLLTVEEFSRCCHEAKLPLCSSECYMLAQLLSRKRPAAATSAVTFGQQPLQEYDDSIEASLAAAVDPSLLQRIKAGEFLHAALV